MNRPHTSIATSGAPCNRKSVRHRPVVSGEMVVNGRFRTVSRICLGTETRVRIPSRIPTHDMRVNNYLARCRGDTLYIYVVLEGSLQ